MPSNVAKSSCALRGHVSHQCGEENLGAKQNPKKSRFPFPGCFFFCLPIPLIEDGIAAQMSGSEFKRYVTFLRVSNYRNGASEIQVSFRELEKMDGVSGRSARLVNTKLTERGLILVKKTRPLTVILIPPSCWPEPLGERPVLQRAGVRVRTQHGPKSWGVIL
jgi:hypothetical protein